MQGTEGNSHIKESTIVMIFQTTRVTTTTDKITYLLTIRHETEAYTWNIKYNERTTAVIIRNIYDDTVNTHDCGDYT